MFKYVWEVTGEIPTVSWQWIVETFGFRLPGEKEQKPKEEREIPFELYFKGDFKFLDMVKLADVLNLAPELLNAEDSKYAIICPWQSEHTETAQADTSSTVIYQKELGTHWPAFKCLHSHCETREIKDVILGRRAGRRASSTGIARPARLGGQPDRRRRQAEDLSHAQINGELLPLEFHPEVVSFHFGLPEENSFKRSEIWERRSFRQPLRWMRRAGWKIEDATPSSPKATKLVGTGDFSHG